VEDLLYFEDLKVGQVWTSPARVVSSSDVAQFAHLTGDFDPLHTDPEFAADSPYGRPIAHGLLGLSLLAGMSSDCPRLKTFAFTEIRDWQFRRPIFFEDSITAEAEVASLRPRGRRCGEVIWARRLRNQLGEIVQHGTLVTLVACRFTANSNGRYANVTEANVMPASSAVHRGS
jgi:3-hydroxybutyryl-CoA dehydratase